MKFVNRKEIIRLIFDIRCILFPSYFELIKEKKEKYYTRKINNIKRILRNNINDKKKEEKIKYFISSLPMIKNKLQMDLDAFIKSDPAATSLSEIILAYPGFFAILVYRIAHMLTKLDIKLIPRLMTEYAHEKTGIDIHPKAVIGDYFFIDHGTGIVIGETTIINNNVKIYHGVTLGTKSLKETSKLKNVKRHPTILDNVTIYSGATILGGSTIIHQNSIIGCNTIITSSIAENSIVINNTSQIIKNNSM